MDISAPLERVDCLTQIFEWGHNHTKEIQIARFFLDGIGATFILMGVLAIGADVTIVVLTGIAIIVVVEVTMIALETLGVIAIDPREHVYETCQINHSRLYYEGDLPILKIRAETHYEAGFDHGYLIAHQIVSVIRRLNILFYLGYLGAKSKLYEKLKEVRKSIPPEYMEEMKGLVAGVNKLLKEESCCFASEYTIEDALAIHMLPDLMHLALAPSCLFGCTTFAGKDDITGQMGVGRNLDWPGLGVGRLTLLKDIKIGDNPQLLEPTIPGCIGVITGMNDKRLFIAINVTEPKGPIYDVEDGMLSLFLNRKVLEKCTNIDKARKFLEDESVEHSPTVPFHLFVASEEGAFFAHLKQGNNGETYFRSYDPDSDAPFFTLNCRHSSEEPPTEPNTLYYGSTRFNNIHTIWEESGHLPLAERLKLVMHAPGVDNPMTVHSVLWMGDHLIISFDNSYAASGQKCVVFLGQQFESDE